MGDRMFWLVFLILFLMVTVPMFIWTVVKLERGR